MLLIFLLFDCEIIRVLGEIEGLKKALAKSQLVHINQLAPGYHDIRSSDASNATKEVF